MDVQSRRAKFFVRGYCDRAAAEQGEPGTPIRFRISTEGVKRDGKNLKAADWSFDNFRRNNVVLWVHDYSGRNLPIGRADVLTAGKDTLADITFDQADEFARQVERKYRTGFLHAVSVGWSDVRQPGGRVLHDLQDISAVPVPADPDALIQEEARQLRALGEEFIRMTQAHGQRTPAGKTTVGNWLEVGIEDDLTDRVDWLFSAGILDRDERQTWKDAAATAVQTMVQAIDRIEGLRDRSLDLWRTASYAGRAQVPTTNDAASAASEVDAWTGIASAMLALYRQPSAQDEATRKKLYVTLERAYHQLDKEPPEYRTAEELNGLGPAEIDGLFLEDEVRAGAVLSSRNRDDLEQAVKLVQGVIDRATKETTEDPPGTERTTPRQDMSAMKALLQKLMDMCDAMGNEEAQAESAQRDTELAELVQSLNQFPLK